MLGRLLADPKLHTQLTVAIVRHIHEGYELFIVLTEQSIDNSKVSECKSLKEKRIGERSLSDRIEDVMRVKKILHEKHPM